MGLIMLYAGTGRLDEALEQVEEVRAIDPLWVQLAASTEVFVRFFRRELPEALAAAREALELHPYLPLGRALYAQALESSGDTRGSPQAVPLWPPFFVRTFRGCGRWKRSAW